MNTFLFVGQGAEPVERDDVDLNLYTEIEPILPFFWRLQGTGIEPGLVIVCAEDARDHQPNSCGIYGPYLIARIAKTGDFRALGSKQIIKCKAWFAASRDTPCPTRDELAKSWVIG